MSVDVTRFSFLLNAGFHPKPIVAADSNWWVAALLFACFTMLVLLRVFDNRRLVQLFNGFVRQSSVSLLYREEYALTGRVSVLLLLNYVLVISLFAWHSGPYFGVNTDGLATYGMIAAGFVIAYFVKILSTRILGNIFEVKEAAAEYAYNILLFNKTTGLILFPLVLLMAYAREIPLEILVWTGIVSWSIVLLYRILRVFLIGLSTSSVSFFYIILYLCTLEILPFVVIIKVFVGNFQSFHP